MVIGTGLLAQAFKKYTQKEDLIVFASGVSNSKGADISTFDRETELLSDTISRHPGKQLIYFSTTSLLDPDVQELPYALHKRKIEKMIEVNCEHYLIFRLSNVVGHSDNPHTVFNFFFNKIKNQEFFNLWINAERNLIDLDDVKQVVTDILDNNRYTNSILNLLYPGNCSVPEMVAAIETYLGIKGNYEQVEKGNKFIVQPNIAESYFEKPLPPVRNYITSLLEKYKTL